MRNHDMLDLYIIRHAEAVPLGQEGFDRDEDRPLTALGAASCRLLARALQHLAPGLDHLLTSPLVRARETAQAVVQQWGENAPKITETDLLRPGSKKRKLLDELRAQPGKALGLVGHNPDLSELIGWFIGNKNVGIDLDKAGVARLHFSERPGKGNATLVWLVTPAWFGQEITPRAG